MQRVGLTIGAGWRWVQVHAVQILGVFVIALTLVTGVQSLRAELANQRATESLREATRLESAARQAVQGVVDCLKDYSNKVADAIEARGAATGAANDSELDLFKAIFNTAPTPEGQAEARRIFSAYLATQDQARLDRQAHPFPDPPRDACR